MNFFHFVFKVFDHLYHHYSEFSFREFAYSSFIWTFVFLVCSFICVVFLCLFINFLTYCVWVLLFPGFRVEFFLPFSFCPLKVGPVVCVNFIEGEICAEFLFVCFSSDGQGWVRWYSCLLMIEFAFLFYLLFIWAFLHRVLLVVGWCQVLYSSVFFVWVITVWYSLWLVFW